MDTFYNWLTGNMGTGGDYRNQSIHINTVLIVLAVTALVMWLSASKRLTQKQKRDVLVGICVFQLAFEVVWRLVFFFVMKDQPRNLWPMYPCNLNGILVPIIALCNWKTGKKLMYLFSFVGGVLTFSMPLGIFTKDVMVFPVLKSVLQHTGVLIIPLMEFASGAYRPNIRHMGWIVAGLLIHLVNGEVICPLIGLEGDFMYFRSGMPFVIPGVPQFITLSVFALLVLSALCLLSGLFDKRSARHQAAAELRGPQPAHLPL